MSAKKFYSSAIIFLSLITFVSLADLKANDGLQNKINRLEKMQRQDPNNKKLQTSLANLYFKTKDYEKAARLYTKAIDEKDPRSYLRAATAYRAQKKYLDEIRILNLMLPKNPNYPKGYVLLANALIHLEKLDEAILKYRQAIEINPKYEAAYWGLFKVYDKKNNNYESRIILLDLIKNFGDKPMYLNPLCRLFSEDSFFESSIEYCKQAIEKKPEFPDNHIFLALTYKNAKNQLQAEKIIKKAADQFKDSELAQKTAGEIMFESENWERASSYYKNCTDANKKNLDCQLGLAMAAFKIGQYELSNKAFLAACKLDRKITAEYKKSAAILRINKKKDWYNRFTKSINQCY